MTSPGAPDHRMRASNFFIMIGAGVLAVMALLVSTVAFGVAVFNTEVAVGSSCGGSNRPRPRSTPLP